MLALRVAFLLALNVGAYEVSISYSGVASPATHVDIVVHAANRSVRLLRVASETPSEYPHLATFSGHGSTVLVRFDLNDSRRPLSFRGPLLGYVYLPRSERTAAGDRRTDNDKSYEREVIKSARDDGTPTEEDAFTKYSGTKINYTLKVAVIVDAKTMETIKKKNPKTKDEDELVYIEAVSITNMIQNVFLTINYTNLKYQIKVKLAVYKTLKKRKGEDKAGERAYFSDYLLNNIDRLKVDHTIFIISKKNNPSYTFFKGICLGQTGMSVLNYSGGFKDWIVATSLVIRNLGGGHCSNNGYKFLRYIHRCDAYYIFKLLVGGVANEIPRTCLLDRPSDRRESADTCQSRSGKEWLEVKANAMSAKLDAYCSPGEAVATGQDPCLNITCREVEGVRRISNGGSCGVCGEVCSERRCSTAGVSECSDTYPGHCQRKLARDKRACFLPGVGDICCSSCARVLHLPWYLLDSPYFDTRGRQLYKQSTAWREFRCFRCDSTTSPKPNSCEFTDTFESSFVNCEGGCWSRRVQTVLANGRVKVYYQRGCMENAAQKLLGCTGNWNASGDNEDDEGGDDDGGGGGGKADVDDERSVSVTVNCCRSDLCNRYTDHGLSREIDSSKPAVAFNRLAIYTVMAFILFVLPGIVYRYGGKQMLTIDSLGKAGLPAIYGESATQVNTKGQREVDQLEELANMLYAVQPNTIEMGNEVQAALEIQRNNIRAKLANRLAREEKEKKELQLEQSAPVDKLLYQTTKTDASADTTEYNANNDTPDPGTLDQYYP